MLRRIERLSAAERCGDVSADDMDATRLVLIMLLAVVASRLIARAVRLPVPLIQIALGCGVFYSGCWV